MTKKIKWTDAKLEKIKRMAETMTVAQIATKLNIKLSTIYGMLHYKKIRAVNSNKKIKRTAAFVKRFKKLYPINTIATVAEKTNISRATVNRIAGELGIKTQRRGKKLTFTTKKEA